MSHQYDYANAESYRQQQARELIAAFSASCQNDPVASHIWCTHCNAQQICRDTANLMTTRDAKEYVPPSTFALYDNKLECLCSPLIFSYGEGKQIGCFLHQSNITFCPDKVDTKLQDYFKANAAAERAALEWTHLLKHYEMFTTSCISCNTHTCVFIVVVVFLLFCGDRTDEDCGESESGSNSNNIDEQQKKKKKSQDTEEDTEEDKAQPKVKGTFQNVDGTSSLTPLQNESLGRSSAGYQQRGKTTNTIPCPNVTDSGVSSMAKYIENNYQEYSYIPQTAT